jgi:hypothetical protein
MKTLIETTPLPGERFVFQGDPKGLEDFERRSKEHTEEQILSQLRQGDEAELLRAEAQAEKLRAKVEAARQEKIEKYKQLEQANEERNRCNQWLTDSQWYVETAGEALRNIPPLIESYYFEGRHPALGRGAPPSLAIDFAAQGSGCQLILDTHKAWSEKTRARIVELGAKMIALAKELGIVDKLPDDLREQVAPRSKEKAKSILEYQLAKGANATN